MRVESTVLATDVGLWMALPAFAPAVVIAAVVVVVVRRDRRGDADTPAPEGGDDAAAGLR